jgi:formylglycine-generating enzyme required for sulfatase activity
MAKRYPVLLAVVVLSGNLGCAIAGRARPPSPPFNEPVTGMEMVYVKGGCYQMGNTFDTGGPEEKPVHEVCVDDFYMGKHEVTQGQWKKIMGSNPSTSNCGDDCPVVNVSWNDAQAFIGQLNSRTGGDGPPASRYRLPTEAEWEYAARSGGKNERYSGRTDDYVDAVAWYYLNADSTPHPVGLKVPTGLGIHDMAGNVWEWTNDRYGSAYYSSSPRDNPTGPSSGDARVLRGGSFRNDDADLRASFRNYLAPDHRSDAKGFRLLRTVPTRKR